jgi:hypothetical protein
LYARISTLFPQQNRFQLVLEAIVHIIAFRELSRAVKGMYRSKDNPKTKEYQIDPKHVQKVKGGAEQSRSRGDSGVDTTPLSPAARRRILKRMIRSQLVSDRDKHGHAGPWPMKLQYEDPNTSFRDAHPPSCGPKSGRCA